MPNNLDKTGYIQLLKKDDTLKNKKKFLFQENRAEYLELLSYGIILESQIYYNRKDEYLSLIEEYRAATIDAILFRLQAVKILEKDFKRLSNFLIDSKSDGFSSLISQIFDDCDALAFDFDREESYGILLKKSFSKCKSICKSTY